MKFGRVGREYIREIDKSNEHIPFEKLIDSLNNSLGVRAVRYTKIISSPPIKIKMRINPFHIFHVLL